MEGLINPFRGLLPFEEQHAALFFGRDKEIREVAERLEQRRLLAVTGVSGSGKSSLVMAGVIPMLRAGLIPSLGTNVRVAIMKPRGGPLFELQRQLTSALNRHVSMEDLTRTTYGLVDVVKSPMYATGVGLVVYGARHTDRRLFRIREENVYRKVRGRMREWLEEIF